MSAARRPRLTNTRDRAGGFVLLELILALTIVSLLAALALPFARPFDGTARLRLKAQEIAVLLRRDRDAALRGQRPVSAQVDLARRSVRSGAANGEVAVPEAYALRASAAALQGIRFAPDGRTSGGEIFLSSLTGGGLVAVRVDDLTGAVTVLREAGHGH
jgi:general secretion pathway protein H